MNIKLHTPKSLKSGSGMATVKQFLLSIVATSISIALTFGTAAVIDSRNKEKEKHEIVMMVMYDMYNSLQSIQQADSMIYESMRIQRQIAEDTIRFDSLRFQLVHCVPVVDYTETTERIYSSSIETINTVGNVLFTENVSSFYQSRQFYKTEISDSTISRIIRDSPFNTLKGALSFDYSDNAMISARILQSMRHEFVQCQQMIDVTDEEIEAYRAQRKQLEESTTYESDSVSSMRRKVLQLQQEIDQAVKKLKIE